MVTDSFLDINFEKLGIAIANVKAESKIHICVTLLGNLPHILTSNGNGMVDEANPLEG
jgi:hypothetical protein